jgi:formylglycine-generating enzyme required for sulfatase activity
MIAFAIVFTGCIDPNTDTTAPADVTGLTATAGNAQVALEWTEPSDTDYAKVEISGTGFTTVEVTKGTAVTTIEGLTNGTIYTFMVKSVDTTGNKSAGVTTTATPVAPDTTAPANVTGLTATAGNAQVVLGWTEPSDTDFAKVEISGTGFTTVEVTKGTATTTLTGLTNGTAYTFTVKSVDTAGNKSAGVTATATPVVPDTTAPADVMGLRATAGDTQVELGWTEPSDTDFEKVEISGTGFTTVEVTKGTAATTITGLTNGTAYTFTVKSVDTTGNKSAGATVTATPMIPSMISVTGGTFNNGTAAMTVSSFYMGKYEITQAEWQAVMGSNPSSFATTPASGEVQENRPVEQVSWYACIVYCNKRSINESLTPCYTISNSTNPADWGSVPTSSDSTWNAVTCNMATNGYRLPTEAEWEFAARGGNSTLGYTYSGSNTVGDVAWYSSNSSNMTHEVGKKDANELGLCDMSGNVWEWCQNWYAAYPSTDQTDYTGPATGFNRLTRGGSFNSGESSCHTTSQGSSSPSYIDRNLGFRVVRRP